MKKFFKKFSFVAVAIMMLLVNVPLAHATSTKFIIEQVAPYSVFNNQMYEQFIIITDGSIIGEGQAVWTASSYTNEDSLRSDEITNLVSWATSNGYPSATSADVLNYKSLLATVATTGAYSDLTGKPTIPSTTRTTSTLSLSLVGTGATGTQVSSSKDSTVRVTVSTSATATISGAATSTVVIKKCATNSSTEGDWTTVGTSETSQSYSLAIALQGVTGGKAQLETDVPSGWYVKIENSGSGTHSESIVSGEKTIYG